MYGTVLGYEAIRKLLGKFWQTLDQDDNISQTRKHPIRTLGEQEQSEKPKNNQQNLKEDPQLD